jgi:hypothetical protein
VYRSWTKRTTPLPQKAIPDKWYSCTVEQLPLPGVEEHLKKHPLQPHQMSRAQYEADPQTMWRAEGADTLGGSQAHWKSSGLHFGEYAAAKERGEGLSRYDHVGGTRPVRMFSLRTKGRFTNEPVTSHPAAEVLPQTKGVAPDEDIGNSAWAQRSTGRWYRNEVEGYNLPTTTVGGIEYVNKMQRRLGPKNILSGYVPRRKGFLTTHSEEVIQAHAEGKSVHPTILQQAQIGPEYSETIEPTERRDQREHRPGRRTLARPEHPAKLFQAINEFSSSPTYVSNEDYDEMLGKHADPERNEPILAHIVKPRPAGSSR